MISASEVTVQFGEKPLFENVSLRLVAGNCYGFIGANGAGKSTFIKVMAGDLEPNTGTVMLDEGARMAVLRQDQFAYEDQKVLETVLQGHKEVWDIQQQMDAMYTKEDFSDEDGEALAKLQERFDELDGYSQESNAAEVLTNLGVLPETHDGLMADLDAAIKVGCCWRRRFSAALMCCCLMNRPTTWTSIPLRGLNNICKITTAVSPSSATTVTF